MLTLEERAVAAICDEEVVTGVTVRGSRAFIVMRDGEPRNFNVSIWRRRNMTASERARRERHEAPAKDHVHAMSVEDQIVDRLKRMKLPEPPPGAKERALARYHDMLREQGRQNWR
jgi:hypothetical protein